MTNFSKRILYEDNHLIIVNKQHGEIVQADKTGDPTLADAVKQYLQEKLNKPGAAYLGTIHRIDRPVSGIVMFAKTSRMLSRMNELLRNQQIRKIYLAVVCGRPHIRAATLQLYLKKDKEQNKTYVFERSTKGALLSELSYETRFITSSFSLLQVFPATGRPHQIRAMLAHTGCPVNGDVKYGAPRANLDGSIHLHARSVSFVHPVSKQNIEITCPVPDEVIWLHFESRLK